MNQTDMRNSAADRRMRLGAAWPGVVLIALGVLFLVGQYVPNAGRYIPLVVGLALFGLFLATRQYGLLIPGGIVTGVGVGILLAEAVPERGGLFLMALGGGFISIWAIASLLRMRENHWWPLIPGGILLTLGVVDLADEGGQLGDLLDLAWPVALIVLGVLVVARTVIRQRGEPESREAEAE